MIKRFVGDDGRRRLIAALREHRLVANDGDLACAIAERAELRQFEAGDTIILEGAVDNCVYFIVSGATDVFVDGSPIAVRRAEEQVGEMAAVDPAAPRSATVRARETTVVARLDHSHFDALCAEFPSIWKQLALVLSRRLRARRYPERRRNARPRVFVGSSTEAVEFARVLQKELASDEVEVVGWSDDIFGPSHTVIESLERAVETFDFGIFMLTPDDIVSSRLRKQHAPRDNIIFELGLFIGAMGRERTFLVSPRSREIKLPSDLFGVVPLTFAIPRARADLPAHLGETLVRLRRRIAEQGVR